MKKQGIYSELSRRYEYLDDLAAISDHCDIYIKCSRKDNGTTRCLGVHEDDVLGIRSLLARGTKERILELEQTLDEIRSKEV